MFLVRSLWESRGYDILYANWIGAGIVGAVLNMITSKPLVVSFRGDDGYLARDRRIWRFLTLWVCRWSAKIAPVSSEIANILIELGVSREKIILPRFGVDTRLFRPLKSKKNQENTVDCLFVGSLIPRKGLHDLIEAMADESLSHMGLIVVGEGFQRENLVKRSNELGIGERVQWKGALSPDQVAQIMRNSDLLCLPAFMEGRPNVVNEAMSSGIPVVAARIGGIPDMVEEGATALLFEPGDVAGLRKQLKTLADDPQLRRKMGKRAREFVLESGISWDNTAGEFDSIFRSIV
jgi:glycosyltransferase involved in cell wall biosynthesis